MKRELTRAVLVLGVLALGACDVDKTQEGEMPEVDVKEGQLPKYDVDAPDVDVKTREETVDVPDVDVHTEKKTVTVPDVDVKPAED